MAVNNTFIWPPESLSVTGAGLATATNQTSQITQETTTATNTTSLVGNLKAATATLTNVTAATSSTALLAVTAGRKQAMFFNDSTAILYLKMGTTASTTSYTVQIPAGGYYELPSPSVYTGIIQGIWSAVNGAVRITELT